MDLHPFRILSLCSGVGGIELGFKLAEPTARTVCYVEIEAFACEILARRMEEKRLDAAPIWTNLKTFNGRPWRGKVDCITGGYPCQPFSVAGKKLGTNDPRHLWPDIKRLITEIEPPICFFENVSNHLRVGFEEVANDLRQMGYKIKAGLFTAQEVGAPHQRERLFILAYSDSFGSSLQSDRNTSTLERKSAGEKSRRNQFTQTSEDCCSGSMADNNSDRCFGDESKTTGKNDQERWSQHVEESISGGNNFAATGFSKEQNGFTEQDSRFALPDEESLANCDNPRLQETRTEFDSTRIARGKQELADSQNFICKWCEQERNRDGESKAEAGSYDNELADSESSGARKHERELWQGSEKYSNQLVNPNCVRFGSGFQRENWRQHNDETSGSITENDKAIFGWPPSPSDYERWNRVPNHLKPALHRMADGMACRVDRIRACGNGVVPLVAAYAWRTLTNGMYLTKDN